MQVLGTELRSFLCKRQRSNSELSLTATEARPSAGALATPSHAPAPHPVVRAQCHPGPSPPTQFENTLEADTRAQKRSEMAQMPALLAIPEHGLSSSSAPEALLPVPGTQQVLDLQQALHPKRLGGLCCGCVVRNSLFSFSLLFPHLKCPRTITTHHHRSDGSAVKSTDCECPGPEFTSQPAPTLPTSSSAVCNSGSKESVAVFWTCWVRHSYVCPTQKHV